MISSDLRLAWLSIRRTPWLSLLLVVAIGIGVGAATSLSTLRHSLLKDPLPGKSRHLFYVQLDNWSAGSPYPGGAAVQLPPQLAYRDAINLEQLKIPAHQTITFPAQLKVVPETSSVRPFQQPARVCQRDFFEMFRLPFAYGGAWSAEAESGAQPVAVISDGLNQKLFGGGDSIGKSIRAEGREFRVVGILAPWRPTVRYYDLVGNSANAEELFIPFSLMIPMELETRGNTDGWGAPTAPGFMNQLMGEYLFLQLWVELPDRAAERSYADALDQYVLEQKKAGRFPRPVNNRLTDMPGMFEAFGVAPPETKGMQLVSLLFLAVCSLNLIGLLLGKFLARAHETGIRRALGASRVRIFMQHLIECESMALLGGLLGIFIAYPVVAAINLWAKSAMGRGDLFTLDGAMLLLAVSLALASGLLAGAYPSWRMATTAVAETLRS